MIYALSFFAVAALPIDAVETSTHAPTDCMGDWAPAINHLARAGRSRTPKSVDPKLNRVVFGAACSTYVVRSTIHGFGLVLAGAPGVEIHCEDIGDAPCVWGHYPDTYPGYPLAGTFQDEEDPYVGAGGPLVIESLTFKGVGSTGAGVRGSWKFTARDVRIQDFGGNGVELDCGANRVDGASNCNRFRLESVESVNNGGHGFYVNGGDANAGLATGIDASGNAGWGWYSNSFLGNALITPHFADNAMGAISVSNPNARTAVVGLYVEGGTPVTSAVNVRPPSMVFQGIGGVYDAKTPAIREGRMANVSASAGNASAALAPEANVHFRLGHGGSKNARIKNVDGYGLVFDYANFGGYRAMIMTTDQTNGGKPKGRMWFQQGSLHGPTALQDIYVSSSDQLPDPANMPLGSRAWHTAPTADSVVMWVVATSTLADGVEWVAR